MLSKVEIFNYLVLPNIGFLKLKIFQITLGWYIFLKFCNIFLLSLGDMQAEHIYDNIATVWDNSFPL